METKSRFFYFEKGIAYIIRLALIVLGTLSVGFLTTLVYKDIPLYFDLLIWVIIEIIDAWIGFIWISVMIIALSAWIITSF